jgi:DNA mismatch repair ATPase MutS
LDNPVDILWMYLDIFFLIEAIAFYRSLSFIQSHRADVIELFCRLGEVDFLRSTAALREALAADRKICCPEFSGLKSINSTEVYHPLIDSAVENDISLKSPGLLLTGANMAGKSTFLRTIGVNCILSQSILTVFADRWESDVFIIKSSIEKQDSIISGKSFYYAEAERVGKILNLASESNLPVLCLFDELLSGTNTEEREAAVTSIIRGAASMNTLCLAATHDRKVVDEFHNSFLLKHFTYRFDESGLVFDYKLQDGRVQNGNAIELLKYLGYPGKIVDDAFELIRR